MKKSLKLVAIFIGVLIVAVVGGTAGYILISNNQTYYIYDLRLVEPLEDANGYLYSDDTLQYVKMDDKNVYLKDVSSDYFNVGVYVNTSNNSADISFRSSDQSVAYFDTSVSGELRVKYVKEGTATLSASIGGVTASFDVTVYNLIPSSFQVFDYDYYGKFAEEPQFINVINTYSDNETTYYYNYKVDATKNQEGNFVNNDNINNANLRVDYFDDELFKSVTINQATKQLVLTCLPDVTTNNGTTQIVIQSFFEQNGSVSVVDSYIVNVSIQSNKPEFLQVELSATPNFDEKAFFVDATNMAEVDDEGIIDQFEQYVQFQKTEMYLSENGETPIYDTYFTDQVDRIYLRFRTVYTNGQIEYLELGDELTCENEKLKPTYFGDSYYLELKREDFNLAMQFGLELRLEKGGVILSHAFNFKYYELSDEFLSSSQDDFWNFYAYDSETKAFNYIYWDYRARSTKTKTSGGKIVGFENMTPDLSKFEAVEE